MPSSARASSRRGFARGTRPPPTAPPPSIATAAARGRAPRGEPFFRPPKQVGASGVLQALTAAREETLMMLGLTLSAWAVAHFAPTEGQDRFAWGPDRLAWIVVLLVQSVPYASSLLVSLSSAFPLPARLLGTHYRPLTASGKPAETGRAS